MTYRYKKQEWTAFTEADLLGAGSNTGHSIGYGDTFTMPGSATVTMSTWDNDRTLSGGNYDRATDSSGQYARVDGHRVGSQMYAEQYHVLHGSDGKVYYLIEIEVEGYDAPGAGDNFFTFYGRVPPAGVELTVVQTCNVSGHWVDYSCLGAGDTAPANTPPHFTNVPADGIICIDENTTFVIDLDAADADHDPLTYAISGGRDADFFEIDPDTGELKFIGAPDYENPQSGGHSNSYCVTVSVDDGKGGVTEKDMVIKVKDVGEAAISGRVSEDADCDNTELAADGGLDAGLAGQTVKLYGWDGHKAFLKATTETDADGAYDFGNLDGGWYYVQFETPEGGEFAQKDVGDAKFDSDADAHGRSDWICLADNQELANVDVSIKFPVETGSISGTVFCDTDCDGLNQTETIVAGHDYSIEAEHMYKYGFHSVSGAHASNGCLVVLDCAGGYGDLATAFYGKSGVYDVKIAVQDENDGQSVIKLKVDGHFVEAIRLDADSDGGGSNNGGFSTYVIKDVPIRYGEHINLQAYGDGYEYVRIDKIDFEGQDKVVIGQEPVKEGVLIKLLNADGTAVLDGTGEPITTVTDAHGNYSFDDIPVGDYAIMGVAPDGTEFTIQDAGSDDTIDSDVDQNGMSGTITVTADGNADIDLGVCEKPEPGALSGRYFIDLNDNDVDDGEPGVAGVTVELLNADGTGTGITTTTAADGSYSFEGLDPGTYGVKFTDDVSGLTLVAPNQGGDDTIDSDATDIGGGMSTITGITVVSGETTADNDAGVEDPGTASVGDFAFLDANGNGLQDLGEAGIEGINVTLTGAGADGVIGTADDTTATTTTGADGKYLFENLKAGDYKVTFDTTTTAGLILTAASAAAADAAGNDSDADEATGMTDVFTLSVGEAERDIDAGYVDPGTASIGDKVFFDANGNGQQDAGEAGVDGIGVTLFDAAGNPIATTTTSGGGIYLFDNLNAGDYSVGFDSGDTFVFTDPDVGPDATDSDADQATGRTGTITLGIGEENLTVDAGLVAANTDPEPMDDMGMTCADEVLTLDVLANDTDADGDTLTITQVDGQAIVDGGDAVQTSNGTFVTLVDGQLVFNGEAAYAALDIGESALENISYTVSDGQGGVVDANIAVTFCGDANSYASLADSFPANGTYQVVSGTETTPNESFAFTIKIDGTGDARFDGVEFENAYCLSATDAVLDGSAFATAPVNSGDILSAEGSEAAGVFDPAKTSFFNGQTAADNLDLISYIVAQDYEGQGLYDGWDVQWAIWELTDGFNSDAFVPGGAFEGLDAASVDAILADAAANGEGFSFGDNGTVGAIIDPNPATDANSQPFIVGFTFEDFDCIC